jgi:hypothetical protein
MQGMCLCSPMKGEARDTKDASPTPTSMRQKTRLQKPIEAPLPATATVHTASPMPMSLKPAHWHMGTDENSACIATKLTDHV